MRNKKKITKTKKSLDRNLNIIFIVIIVSVGFGLISFIINPDSNDKIVNIDSSNNQTIVGSWTDVHGIGMFPKGKDEGNSLYLATHNGLFKKDADKLSNWIQIGKYRSDLMGFAINPNKEGVMYSSGHPHTIGNLGFRMSDDYGVTWQKVSDVTTPTPIDFHTITMGYNPEIIYGASDMGDIIFSSLDEGKTWNVTSSPNGEKVITLTANQTDSNIVYASTTEGLFWSTDQGQSWQEINNELINGNSHDTIVTGLEISSDGKTVYAFVTPGRGEDIDGYIIKSTDGAKTWTKTFGQIEGAHFISRFGFGNAGEIYAIVNQNTAKYGMASSVYKSNEQGEKWILEGTNSQSLAES